MNTFQEFRSALRIDPGLTDDQVKAARHRCPVCDSSDGLALSRGDSVDVVAKCHACGADYAAIAEALGVAAGFDGCTVEQLAEYLGYPEEWLADEGWRDSPYRGADRVAIPYPNDSIRYRSALDGKRKFSWKSGAKASQLLYNGDALTRTEPEVYLVEGESDVLPLLYAAEVMAVGLPGATQWNDRHHGMALADVPTIYVIVEPDAGGVALRETLSRSVLRDQFRLIDLRFETANYKDAREMYNAVGDRFAEHLAVACSAAKSFAELDEENRAFAAQVALGGTDGLQQEPDLLDSFLAQARTRYTGEEHALVAVFLTFVSTNLERLVNVLIDGVSSGGKSALMEEVLWYFPEAYYYFRTTVSPSTLLYTPESFEQRIIAFAEAKGATKNDDLVYLLRSLLSEGCLRHEVTVKNPETGEFTTKYVEKPGPTGLVMSTTSTWLDSELETRLLRVSIDDSPEQTKRVMLAEAKADQRVTSDDQSAEQLRWRSMFEWQRALGPTRVSIPYREVLSDEIPPVATRLRRDFRALCGFIEAHAILHRDTRETDEHGRVVATLADYAAVRHHLGPFFSEGVSATVSKEIRETVEAVARIIEREPIRTHATYKEVAGELHLDTSTGRQRALKALNEGFLKNTARAHKPAELALDVPLPGVEDDVQLLPDPSKVEERRPEWL